MTFIEELIFGAVDYGGPAVQSSFDSLLNDAASSASASITKRSGGFPGFPLQATSRLNSLVQYVSQEGASTALLQFATRMADAMALQSQAQLAKASGSSYNSAASTEMREEAAALDSASRILKLFVKSVSATSPAAGLDNPEDTSEKYRNVIRRALREPVSQAVISRIVSELSERIAGKTVQRILRRQPLPLFLKS